MHNNPFATAANAWIAMLSKKRKLTKHEKRAVIAFGAWLDTYLQKQDMEEQIREEGLHAKEN